MGNVAQIIDKGKAGTVDWFTVIEPHPGQYRAGLSQLMLRRKLIEGELANIDEAYDEFYKELDRIAKSGNNVERSTLMEVQALSGGSVTTLDDALQWVKVRTKGGRYKGCLLYTSPSPRDS